MQEKKILCLLRDAYHLYVPYNIILIKFQNQDSGVYWKQITRGDSNATDRILDDVSGDYQNESPNFSAQWMLCATWKEMAYPANPYQVKSIIVM